MAFMIGGSSEEKKSPSPFAKKKAKPLSMIGGPEEGSAEEEDAESPAEEESEPMDAEGQKLEAARLLFPENPQRALKALEAFIYACKE